MKKTIIILVAAAFVLFGGILSLAPENSYAVEDPDSGIIMLIESLAEYHSRQFTERDASCEIAMSQDVCKDLAVRQSCINDMQKRIGARFISASVKAEDLTVYSAENGFEVLFNETTVLYYKYPSSTETDQMEFSVFHKVFLTRDLEIVSDEFSEEMITGFSN